MFDPNYIDAPDIFGDLGRDAMKVVGDQAAVMFDFGAVAKSF